MISVKPIILLICYTVETYGSLEINGGRESIVHILLDTIEKEILQVNDLVSRNVEFEEPRCGGSLERVFRNRLDLFFGVPREILTSGLDLTDADVVVLNEFFHPYSSPCPIRVNNDREEAVSAKWRGNCDNSSTTSRSLPKMSETAKTDDETTTITTTTVAARLNNSPSSGVNSRLSSSPGNHTRSRVSRKNNSSSRRRINSTTVIVEKINSVHSTADSRTSLPLIVGAGNHRSDYNGVNLTAKVPTSAVSQRFLNKWLLPSKLAAHGGPGILVDSVIGAGVASDCENGSNEVVSNSSSTVVAEDHGADGNGNYDGDDDGRGPSQIMTRKRAATKLTAVAHSSPVLQVLLANRPDVRRAESTRSDVIPERLDGVHPILTPPGPEIEEAELRTEMARHFSGPRPERKAPLFVQMMVGVHQAANASLHRTTNAAAAAPETICSPSPLRPRRNQRRSRLKGRKRNFAKQRLLRRSMNRVVRRPSRTTSGRLENHGKGHQF